jgi:hypothetical protein
LTSRLQAMPAALAEARRDHAGRPTPVARHS